MLTSTSMRWLVVAVSAAMLLAVAAACSSETIEVPGETVVVKEEVVKTVEVPGETVVKEVVKEVMVPGETVVVEKVVTETVEVPGETVVVEKEVVKTVEVPGETVTVEVVKEVQVPGETVVVEKVVTQTVQVPGETVVVEKEVVKTVEVPGETVVVEKEVVKTVEVPGPERVMVKEVPAGYVTDPSSGKVYVAPQYGGSIAEGITSESKHTDTWWGVAARGAVNLLLDKMGVVDWSIDRDEWDLTSGYTPRAVLRGQLAESYEISPDDLTYTFHIRKGVHWHDKPPMNGRELVAEDIVFSLQRFMGQGDFAEAGPTEFSSMAKLPVESITATDKYTVVIKMAKLSFNAFQIIYQDSHEGSWIYPPEVIQEYGHMQDWKTAVGTGPYMLTDWVKGSAITYTKNPNYWGNDEKFPENRLPYLDEIKLLVMPESSTRLAAFRTGKVGRLSDVDLDQARALQRTNQELLWKTTLGTSFSFAMDVRKPPFDDINVRRAMQLALDVETIGDTFFGGLGQNTPTGFAGRSTIGFHTPFEEWPEELKAAYTTYDPERAKQLLAEAGYPNGFKTKLMIDPARTSDSNLDHTQLAVTYWAEIGADVEIDIVEAAVWRARVNAHSYEGMTRGFNNVNYDPLVIARVATYSNEPWNTSGIQDPVQDALVEAAENAVTVQDMMDRVKEADMRFIEQHYNIWGSPIRPSFTFWQPWMAGYNGEIQMGGGTYYLPFSRVWVDSDLRDQMR